MGSIGLAVLAGGSTWLAITRYLGKVKARCSWWQAGLVGLGHWPSTATRGPRCELDAGSM